MIIQPSATYAVSTHTKTSPVTQRLVPIDRFQASGTEFTPPTRASLQRAVNQEQLEPTQQDHLGEKYFREGAPKRFWLHSLGEPGFRFWMPGSVKGTDGQPIQDAKVEFWVADDKGEYSQDDYKGRGWQKTDESGFYQVHCVRPGNEEEGMPGFLNVRVTAEGYKPLTTRLFFEDDIHNRFDPGFHPDRELELGSTHWGSYKFFTADKDFVLRKTPPADPAP